MKKLTIFTFIAVALILSGCTKDNAMLNNNVNEPVINTNVNTNTKVTNNNSNDNSVINENSNTNDQVVDPLASWKTFSNPNGNYSFKYPSTWNATISKYNKNNSLFGLSANSGAGLGGVELNDFSGSLNEYIKYLEENVEMQFTSKENTTVSGMSAIQVNYTGVATQIGHGVYIKNGNQMLNIYINSLDKNNLELFDKLLSTFKLGN